MNNNLKRLAVLLLVQVLFCDYLLAQANTGTAIADTGSGANTVNANTVTDPNGHQVPATQNPPGNSAGSDLPSANNSGVGTETIGGKEKDKNGGIGNWGLLGLLGLLGLMKLNRQGSRERIT